MRRFWGFNSVMAAAFLSGLFSIGDPLPAAAQSAPPGASAAVPQAGSFLLTIFLRHDQSKTVDQINEHLKQTGWYDKFPPEGVEIVSWYVMMGVGQVVILRVPPISCVKRTGSSSRAPGAAIARSSTRPTTSSRFGTRSRTTARDRSHCAGTPRRAR